MSDSYSEYSEDNFDEFANKVRTTIDETLAHAEKEENPAFMILAIAGPGKASFGGESPPTMVANIASGMGVAHVAAALTALGQKGEGPIGEAIALMMAHSDELKQKVKFNHTHGGAEDNSDVIDLI